MHKIIIKLLFLIKISLDTTFSLQTNKVFDIFLIIFSRWKTHSYRLLLFRPHQFQLYLHTVNPIQNRLPVHQVLPCEILAETKAQIFR